MSEPEKGVNPAVGHMVAALRATSKKGQTSTGVRVLRMCVILLPVFAMLGAAWFIVGRSTTTTEAAKDNEVERLEQHEAAIDKAVAGQPSGTAEPLEPPPEPATLTIIESTAPTARECNQGDVEACLEAGRLHSEGPMDMRDEEKAARLFRKACDGGLVAGCGNLGALTVQGRGVEYDPVTAYGLFVNACASGHAPSCFNQAGMIENGVSVDKDPKRARRLYNTACEGGLQAACEAAAQIRGGR